MLSKNKKPSKINSYSRRNSVFNVDMLSQYGVYYPTRTIILSGEIEERTLDRLMGGLELLDKEGDVITVKLFSFGGNFYEGLGIYDALRACRSEITIIGYGAVMSMGTVILQAADKGRRLLMPNSTVMCHQGINSFAEDHPTQNKKAIEEADRIRNLSFKILADNMGITLAQFNRRFQFDVYMSAEEAVAHKIADAIASGD